MARKKRKRKHKNNKRKSRTVCRQVIHKRRLRKAGRCVDCGEPRTVYKHRCNSCQKKERERWCRMKNQKIWEAEGKKYHKGRKPYSLRKHVWITKHKRVTN